MAAVASARYPPPDAPVALSPTNPDKPNDGAQDTSAAMSDGKNPIAPPFRPLGTSAPEPERREPYPARVYAHGHVENQPPAPTFHVPVASAAPWNTNYAPPPPYEDPQHAHDSHVAQAQAQAYYTQWAQYCGYMGQNYMGNQAALPQYLAPPYGQQLHAQQFHAQQPYGFAQPNYNYSAPPSIAYPNQRNFTNSAYQHHAMQSQTNFPAGATNGDIQYAFDALIKGLKAKSNKTNSHYRASTPPVKKSKAGTAANGQAKQKDTLQAPQKKGRYGDKKIMLPAPRPTTEYLTQATEEPFVVDPPNTGRILVILDLNGTVLFRPNRNAKTMIERPHLKSFLRYLFKNFKVMVWSSAKPDNVKSLVNQSLDNDLRSKLVAHWGRDSFGLSASHYNLNVQVYKNLKLIWSRDQLQQHHPDYATGQRFGQHNTVLIDDSAIKASAQPHNLLEIPEFSATPQQMEGDVLREVAGYLEMLRQQGDVSKFMRKEPFKDDGRWSFQWPDKTAGGGEMQSKVSMRESPKTTQQSNEQQQPKVVTGETAAENASQTQGGADDVLEKPMTEAIDGLSSVSLSAPVQKE